jgi:hypothetical protein
MTHIKISTLIMEIDKKIADPATKTRRYSNATFYFIRKFTLTNPEAAYRCADIIRSIIGYNVRTRWIDGDLWVLVAHGMQKKALTSPVSA